jgi:serine/threonine protein phosphatase PrpC
LLTTDGILDYIDCEISVSETKIAEIVLEAPDAAHACADMIIQANLGGGGDNCGVGLIRVKPSK